MKGYQIKNLISIVFINIVLIYSTTSFANEIPELQEIQSFNCDKYKTQFIMSKSVVDDLSKAFNKYGFRAYKKSNFKLAASLFRCAFLKNEQNYLAHYNYASVMSLFNARLDDYCDMTFLTEAIDHLQISIQLNEKRRNRVLNDSDFDSIRNDYMYKLLTLDPKSSLKDIVVTMRKWYAERMGIHGISKLEFSGNGTVVWKVFEAGKDGKIGEWSNGILGKFKFVGNQVFIKFNNYKIKQLKGRVLIDVNKNTIIGIQIDFENYHTHTPDPDDCNA